MMKYIGTKMVEAERAFKIGDVIRSNKELDLTDIPEGEVAQMGYRVKYPDGYESFSPKDVFEAAYLPVGEDYDSCQRGDTITEKMVDDFIGGVQVEKLGSKTTVVKATLMNGFEIVESSSCVDPANYDEEVGKDICLAKIKDQIWYLLGFLLQTAKYGVTYMPTKAESADSEESIAEDSEEVVKEDCTVFPVTEEEMEKLTGKEMCSKVVLERTKDGKISFSIFGNAMECVSMMAEGIAKMVNVMDPIFPMEDHLKAIYEGVEERAKELKEKGGKQK